MFGSIKLEEFLDHLRTCWLLKRAKLPACMYFSDCQHSSFVFSKPNIEHSEGYFWRFCRFSMHTIKQATAYYYSPRPFILLRHYAFLLNLCLQCFDSVFLWYQRSATSSFMVVTYILKMDTFNHVLQTTWCQTQKTDIYITLYLISRPLFIYLFVYEFAVVTSRRFLTAQFRFVKRNWDLRKTIWSVFRRFYSFFLITLVIRSSYFKLISWRSANRHSP